ncbi:hypothetical protein DM860_017143 [Cuscuta australis]|uniref:Uncharacterized protein n=1 Tax=Cuscuta australis TaxID=267555 RepID=A0A328DDK0_9ASTE|nr:hypothetical protein DM860_017143 [Cuscuta australis]
MKPDHNSWLPDMSIANQTLHSHPEQPLTPSKNCDKLMEGSVSALVTPASSKCLERDGEQIGNLTDLNDPIETRRKLTTPVGYRVVKRDIAGIADITGVAAQKPSSACSLDAIAVIFARAEEARWTPHCFTGKDGGHSPPFSPLLPSLPVEIITTTPVSDRKFSAKDGGGLPVETIRYR